MVRTLRAAALNIWVCLPRRAETHFSADRMVDNYIEVYRRILGL